MGRSAVAGAIACALCALVTGASCLLVWAKLALEDVPGGEGVSPSEVILSDLARGTDFPEGIAILVLSIVIVFGGSLVGLAKADDVVAYVVLAATSICFVLGLWLAMSADSRSVSAIEGELVDRMNVIQPVDASALSEEGSILEYVEPERAIYLPVLGSSVSLIGAVILFLSAMARPGTPGRPA